MKKVKIMLTAITVMAIVGGALAFKAKNRSLGLRCIYTSSHSTVTCPLATLTGFNYFTGGTIFATTLDPTFIILEDETITACLAGQPGQPGKPACQVLQTYVTE